MKKALFAYSVYISSNIPCYTIKIKKTVQDGYLVWDDIPIRRIKFTNMHRTAWYKYELVNEDLERVFSMKTLHKQY